MLTRACCSDRSHARGLASLQALQLESTLHSERKHFNSRAPHPFSPSLYKSVKWPLLVRHNSLHWQDYPQELDVTFAPLELFICIAVRRLIMQTVVSLVGCN